MSSAKKQLKKDHAFEFAAPQFHDFTSNVDTDPNADVWFDHRRATNAPEDFYAQQQQQQQSKEEEGEEEDVPTGQFFQQQKLRRSKRLSAKLTTTPFNVYNKTMAPSATTGEMPSYMAPTSSSKKRKHELVDEYESYNSVQHGDNNNRSRTLTIAKSPNLMTRVRAAIKPKTAADAETFAQFKALPLDRRIFESSGDMGVPRIQKHSLTEPQPFSFATDKRLVERTVQQEESSGKVAKKAGEAPAAVNPHADLFDDSPEKVKQQVFQKPTITEPQPFDLLTEQRGAYYKSYQEIKQKEEEQNKRQRAEAFRARPADALYKAPFETVKSNKPLTTIDPNVMLHSDFRSKERAKFDAAKKKRELEEEMLRQKQEHIRAEQEKRDVEAMRARLVHKAKPMPSFLTEGPLYRPSTKPLTVPESPMFSHKRQKSIST